MDKEGKISIVVPVYNTAKYIDQCVKSLLSQTYRNIEIILVDDGSSDASGNICDKYALYDTRVRVIHKINEGVSKARNVGIMNASGQYLGFLDSDDFVEPDMYEKLMNSLIENEADLCLCRFNDYVNLKKNYRNEPLYEGSYESKQIFDSIILPMIGSSYQSPKCPPIMGSICRGIFNMNLIKSYPQLEFKEIKIAEDLLFIIEYICRCKKIYVLNEPLYNYRFNEMSASRAFITDLYITLEKQMKLMADVLIENKLYNDLADEYLSMTKLYNVTWCITNESSKSNPIPVRRIVKNMRFYRNLYDYKDVLKWKHILRIKIPERLYFVLIKCRLYRVIIWFNRRK